MHVAHTSLTPRAAGRGYGSRKGAELVEFALCFLPLTALIFLLLSAAWGIYVKTTLAFAVHQGVRQGITIDSTRAAGTTLTAMVKNIVQQNAMGLLAGTGGLAKIHVDYFRVSPSDASVLITVTQAAGGIMAGDIIQVSIKNYSLPPLAPRLYNWRSDSSATAISAVAADRIEPFSGLPAI
jgi:Flp pilus assembly protein TadG